MLTTCSANLNLNLLTFMLFRIHHHFLSTTRSFSQLLCESFPYFHTCPSFLFIGSRHFCLSALPVRTRELLCNTCYTMWSAGYCFQGSGLWGARLFHGIPSSLGVIEDCGNESRASGFCRQRVFVARWAYVWRPVTVRGQLEVEKQKHKSPLSPLL